MQVIFKEIVDGRADKVAERIVRDADLIALTATSPPKKYAGQSLLQVAIRSGQFMIASLLVDHGADVNFIDRDSPNGWSAPVLHDAVVAAVMRSRWLRTVNYSEDDPQWQLVHTQEQADEAFGAVRLLLDSGADVAALDSYGNSLLGRAATTAAQILPTHRYNDPDWVDPKPLNDELATDLSRIFDALYARGAEPSKVDPHLDHPVDAFYAAEPVGQFLKRS